MLRLTRRRQHHPDPWHPGQARILHQFVPPIRRWRLAAWWDAWWAVWRQMALQDFLQWRLCCYQRCAPQQGHARPFEVAIVHGETVRIPAATPDPWQQFLADPAGEEAFEATLVRPIHFLNQAESQTVLRDLQQYEEESSRLTARLLEVRETLEAHAQAQQDEIATGMAPVAATLARAPRHRGRPRCPVPWGPWACTLTIAATVLVEAWQFALPYLNAIGVDVTNLAAEWHRNRLGVLAGSAFAGAASAGLFILWHGVLETAVASFRRVSAVPWWQTVCKGLFALALGGLLSATAFAIAAMRAGASQAASDVLAALQGQASAGPGSEGVFILLTILVPFAAAYLQHKSSESPIWERRRRVREQQAQWDHAEHQARRVQERRAALLRLSEEERARLERQRDAVRHKLRTLAEHAQARERFVRERLDAERQFGVAYMQSLLAALEQDRYYFLKAAARKGRAPAPAGSAGAWGQGRPRRQPYVVAMGLPPTGHRSWPHENGSLPSSSSR